MKHPFLLAPPCRLNQPFDGELGGGEPTSSMTRRRFLKRTGAATVATIVAFNLTNGSARADEDNGKSVSEDRASDSQGLCGTETVATTCMPLSLGKPNNMVGGVEFATSGKRVINLGGRQYQAEVRAAAPGIDVICRSPRTETFVVDAKIWDAAVLVAHLRVLQDFRVRCPDCLKAKVSKYPAQGVQNLMPGQAGIVPQLPGGGGSNWDVLLVLTITANGHSSAGVLGRLHFQEVGALPVQVVLFPPGGPQDVIRENRYDCCSMNLLA